MSFQSAITANCTSLSFLHDQISVIPESFYRRTPELTAGSVGGHMRHILEHYLALYEGLAEGVVCYDSRNRNKALEESPAAALKLLNDLNSWLYTLSSQADQPLTLAALTDGNPDSQPLKTRTTLSRELLFLHSHTIHHKAIIAMLMKEKGIKVPASFGVAPSTLRHQTVADSGL